MQKQREEGFTTCFLMADERTALLREPPVTSVSSQMTCQLPLENILQHLCHYVLRLTMATSCISR